MWELSSRKETKSYKLTCVMLLFSFTIRTSDRVYLWVLKPGNPRLPVFKTVDANRWLNETSEASWGEKVWRDVLWRHAARRWIRGAGSLPWARVRCAIESYCDCMQRYYEKRNDELEAKLARAQLPVTLSVLTGRCCPARSFSPALEQWRYKMWKIGPAVRDACASHAEPLSVTCQTS